MSNEERGLGKLNAHRAREIGKLGQLRYKGIGIKLNIVKCTQEFSTNMRHCIIFSIPDYYLLI